MNPTEDTEQLAVIAWCDGYALADPRARLLLHIPNGGARHIATAARLRRLGVRRGVPDLFLPVAVEPYHGLWIEMKRRKGGRVSPERRGWIETLQAEGYAVAVALGADEAIFAVLAYLDGRHGALQVIHSGPSQSPADGVKLP